ncbi:hypothetical protein F5Y19DRAFT_469883 [Xylariaceae sp. FL1651]|nr:hypothetical protein F5Y19DRAFT_469883 [Xylariaceae sp. FL1651]
MSVVDKLTVCACNCRTGVTGYIAGDALCVLAQAHPEFEYAALVRSEDKAARVRDAYPAVRVVVGSLDDAEVLRKEAAWADLVLHAADASDHVGAARAIAAGLVEGHSAARPGYWLHTGGTGILSYFDTVSGRLGELSEKIFNDLDGVSELTSLPDDAFHRNVDKIVLECGTQHPDVVRTAIVCPPTIYGNGRGPISGRSRQVYEMAKLVLTKGYAPIIGAGLSKWSNGKFGHSDYSRPFLFPSLLFVHIQDLTQAFVLLTEAAASGNASPEIWGARGYHFTDWGVLARTVAEQAHKLGLLKGEQKPKEKQLSKDEALAIAGFEALGNQKDALLKRRSLRF